jgi:ABC-2 type transport system permease protein
MAAAYVVYFMAFVALTLAVSAHARSSRGALVALLGFWVFAALIAPRAAADTAETLVPVPSQGSIAEAVRRDVASGLPGGPAREERVNSITEELLESQGFKGAEMLMDAALLSAIELRAEAMFENEVIDHHHERLASAIARRERMAQGAALLSPVVAIRSLSMAFAGTDYAHHRHFSDAAEQHRRDLVEMLNREMGDKGGKDAWAFRAGRELWQRAPTFRHTLPDVRWVARRQMLSLVSLLGWLLLASLAAGLSARRLRVQ